MSTTRRHLVVAATGLLAGLAGGMLGIGGGLVIVPLLTLVLDVPIKRAVGTSLLGVLAIALVAVLTELRVAPANLGWLAAALLAAGAVVGSWLGARLIVATPPRLLAKLLAGLLVLAALKMSGLLDVSASIVGIARGTGSGFSAASWLTHPPVGVVAGIISATFGVGGGILAVPALAVLHPDWTFHACRATSLVMIIPTALAGAVLHGKLQHLDRALASILVPASLAGAVAGVVLANRLAARPLEIAFAALLIVSAVRMARWQPR